MKKAVLSFFIIGCFITLLNLQTCNKHKVFKIISPSEIYIDMNQNYVFDEKEPYKFENIYYINQNLDVKKFPIFSKLNEEEIFFLEYQAERKVTTLLKNKFIELKNNKVYIDNKDYVKTLLNSKLFFNDDISTQKATLEYIKSINKENYRIYNTQSKRIHKLSCKEGRKSKKYKIIHISKLQDNQLLCTSCCKENTNNKELINSKTISEIFESDYIKIFFLELNKKFIPTNICDTAACKNLIKEIDNSKKSIDFAIYGINNQPKLFDALIKAKKRGVKIRWVCDHAKDTSKHYKHLERLKQIIPSYNTDKNYEQRNSSAIMHNKFFIFDKEKVWTGSANITSTDLSGFNANYSLLINSKEIAEIYTKEFEQMYNGLFHKEKETITTKQIDLGNNTKLEIYFSPKNKIVENKLIPLIQKAEDYIYIPIFFFTHKNLANELIDAHNRGVQIKIINDATNSHTQYTMHKKLRASGIKVKTENYAGKMHMKAMIIDDKISVIGSMNYTKSGNNKNDENVVIIYNNEITKYLKETFQYLWNKIPAKYQFFDPRAESFDSIGSCFDGIDNNFDDKIDSKDIGCMIKN